MVLLTKKMSAEPSDSDGLRICVMRDARIYNRQLKSFREKFGSPMYDMHLKRLAPSRELKDAYRNGDITWDDYFPWFTREVLERESDLLQALAQYALENNLTYLCTEDTPERCHRRLLAQECGKYQPGLEMIIE